MNNEYNIRHFGNTLKKIRIDRGTTRKQICEIAYMHIDTLRKIEHGMVIPKYETLEILSAVYKIDLLEVLKLHRPENTLYDMYKELDVILISNKMDDLMRINQHFEDFKIRLRTEKCLFYINEQDLKLFDVFMKSVQLFHSKSMPKLEQCSQIIMNTLEIYEKDILESNRKKYGLLENRLLIVLGMCMIRLAKHTEGITILESVLQQVYNEFIKSRYQEQLSIKLNYQLSYAYYLCDEFEKSLNYANEGLSYAISKNELYMLFALYARKGAAEFHLNQSGYEDSFKKTIQLLEIAGDVENLKLYKNVISKEYSLLL